MAKNNITKDDVYAAALAVQKEGEIPTTINVRAKLNGHGSQTTIHKHLTRWKKLYANDDGESIDQLRAKLKEQQQIIENLNHELLNSSALLNSERAENAKFKTKTLELETRLEEKAQSSLELTALNTNYAANLKASFDAAILLLSDQIRTINAQAINKVQEVGQHFDEQVINLKLELRTLQEQLASRDKELRSLTAQLVDLRLKPKHKAMDREA